MNIRAPKGNLTELIAWLQGLQQQGFGHFVEMGDPYVERLRQKRAKRVEAGYSVEEVRADGMIDPQRVNTFTGEIYGLPKMETPKSEESPLNIETEGVQDG